MEAAKGIYCAVVTPLDQRENIDEEAARRLIPFVLSGHPDGILALGSTGEQIALTAEAKRTYLKIIRECVPAGFPVMAGCGSTSTRLAIENVHMAQEEGADAVIITPPCFFPFDSDGLYTYFTEIAAQSSVPVYLYNISRYAGVRIPVETVRRLLDNPKIMGIKESDLDVEYMQKLVEASRQRPDFSVIQGAESLLLQSFDQGCGACVTVIGNVAPALAPLCYQALRQGDRKAAEYYQDILLKYWHVFFEGGHFHQKLKTGMQAKGLCSSRMTSPFLPLSPAQQSDLIGSMNELERKLNISGPA